MNALSKLDFYPALPGEFTRRAFYNNKLDLTEIEGLADLIHAETEQQRKQALLQANGSLSKLYMTWRKALLNCIANLEAYIDFNEEDNIEGDVVKQCNDSLQRLWQDMEKHLSDGRKGEILRNGIRTVIVGEPNAGKSSLLNNLVQRNAVIVTPIAGTTRDVIELPANISGYPVVLVDTAGLTNNTKDEVEIEGIRRARAQAENSDFIILMVDSLKYLKSDMVYENYISNYINSLNLSELLNDKKTRHIVVMNKIDLLNKEETKHLESKSAVTISCQTQEGCDNLIKSMSSQFEQLCGNPSRENPTISQARYRNHLTRCSSHFRTYFETTSRPEYDFVIAVHEIRMAMRELGMITGHVTSDEILEIIFKNFCIGK